MRPGQSSHTEPGVYMPALVALLNPQNIIKGNNTWQKSVIQIFMGMNIYMYILIRREKKMRPPLAKTGFPSAQKQVSSDCFIKMYTI